MGSSDKNLDSAQALKAHPVVSREEWLAARIEFLKKEKEFTRLREEHSRQRRALPWVKVDKEYVFDVPGGKESFAQLFGPRSQLIVYHFMFNPLASEGCSHCSFWADHFDASGIHLNHRDVSMVAISRASLEKIEAFKQRMGWRFKWASSAANEFNFDFHVSFTPEQVASGVAMYNYAKATAPGDREGFSVFYKDEKGIIYHTYSCFARGIDNLNGTYHFLDMVPKGRDEANLKQPQAWVRYHDRYEA
jgi:predicted dithiol-disulfide oxidoreductase (DUF899 family)